MQIARGFGFQIIERLQSVGQRMAQTQTILRQRLPGIGGGEAAGGAVQQLRAVLRLQPRNMLAHGRWRHAQRIGGGVHAAVFEHGGEHQ